ncbi:hypothetical protein Taro_056808 [Colocasia esculenta]|uniref:GRF-type domain-containing protein n=1 Tax=Colocasia esculenta TaxID=4460 RepID=A0A843XXT4_COLES|nr:hypothetical protein [Colocasia esculenta]
MRDLFSSPWALNGRYPPVSITHSTPSPPTRDLVDFNAFRRRQWRKPSSAAAETFFRGIADPVLVRCEEETCCLGALRRGHQGCRLGALRRGHQLPFGCAAKRSAEILTDSHFLPPIPRVGYRESTTLAMASAASCSMTIPSLRCPCGYGWCDIFTSHTTNNPNRKYYKCKKGSCKFFMWCDEFLALGRSSGAKCECDEVMQKLVEENEILRKRVQELQLQLERRTRITASLGRVISTLTTEEDDN